MWLGDSICDHACDNAACSHDGGDCGIIYVDFLINSAVFRREESESSDATVGIHYFIQMSTLDARAGYHHHFLARIPKHGGRVSLHPRACKNCRFRNIGNPTFGVPE